jgi:hypothetical protein
MRSGSGEALVELGDSPQGSALRAIRDQLKGLHRVGIAGLEPVQVTAFVRAAQGAVDLLELLTARGVAYLEKVHAYEGTGATDMVGFLAKECRLTPEAANERVMFARQLDRLGDTAAGLSSGTLSFAEAAVVAKNTAQARSEDVARVEAMILAKAGEMPPGLLRHEGRAILGEVDSEALRRDCARAWGRRSVRIGPNIDGLSTISGCLTALCAEELRAGLEPYMLPVDKHDTRTAQQRRHDGLHQLCRESGVATQQGQADVAVPRGRRPEVVVVASVEMIAGEDGPPPLLQGIIPISQEELDTILDDANISLAIKNMKGNLAYVGRSARSYSKPKRRAMLAVSPTCAFEGCTRPAVDCTGHHLVEFSRGGETTVDTQAPLCYAHQDRVHRDGWVVLRQSDSGFTTLPPEHPDNPRNGMSPEEYRRRRRDAILRRGKAKGKPSLRVGRDGAGHAPNPPPPEQPRAGPHHTG